MDGAATTGKHRPHPRREDRLMGRASEPRVVWEDWPRHLLAPHLAELLGRQRRRLGWSVADAVARTGLSRQMIQFLERGERCPSVATAEMLAAVYKFSAAETDALLAVAVPDAGRSRP